MSVEVHVHFVRKIENIPTACRHTRMRPFIPAHAQVVTVPFHLVNHMWKFELELERERVYKIRRATRMRRYYEMQQLQFLRSLLTTPMKKAKVVDMPELTDEQVHAAKLEKIYSDFAAYMASS